MSNCGICTFLAMALGLVGFARAGTDSATLSHEFVFTGTWKTHATDKKLLLTTLDEVYCPLAYHRHRLSTSVGANTSFIYHRDSKVCELGTPPPDHYIIQAHSDHGYKLYTPYEINYAKLVVVLQERDFHVLSLFDSEPTEIGTLPAIDEAQPGYLQMIYHPVKRTFYFGSTCNNAATVNDKAFKMGLGADSAEEVHTSPESTLDGFVSLVKNYLVWLAGGGRVVNYGTTFDTTEVLDTQTGTWSEGPNLPVNAAGGCLPSENGREFYMISGVARNGGVRSYSKKVYYYDWDHPDQGWSSLQDIPVAVYRPVCSIFKQADGSSAIGVLGGSIAADGWLKIHVLQDTFQVYDIVGNSWTTKKAYNSPIYRAAAFTHEDKMYVLGGSTTDNEPLADVSVYSASDDTWTVIYTMDNTADAPAIAVINQN